MKAARETVRNKKAVPAFGRRSEKFAAGTLKLVGTDEQVIYENFKQLLEDQNAYDAMSKASNPYGDGMACRRIADILERN